MEVTVSWGNKVRQKNKRNTIFYYKILYYIKIFSENNKYNKKKLGKGRHAISDSDVSAELKVYVYF